MNNAQVSGAKKAISIYNLYLSQCSRCELANTIGFLCGEFNSLISGVRSKRKVWGNQTS